MTKSGLTPIAILIALATAFHSQNLFSGSTWFFQDAGFYYFPLKNLSVNALIKGDLPFWISLADFGMPLFGNLTLGHLYPTTLLYLLFDRVTALNIEVFLHHLLAMLAVYLLCFDLLKTRAGAFLGAVAYGFSGVVVSYFHNPFYLYSSAWTPLSFLALYRLAERPSVRGAAFAGASMAMQLLAGDPQSLIFSAFFAFFCLLFLRGDRKRTAPLMAAAAILAFGLTAFQAMPALEIMDTTHRSGGLETGESMSWSMHPVRFVTMVIPYFWGRLFPENTFWGRHLVNSVNPDRFWAFTIYIGIIPLLLAVYGGWTALKKNGRKTRPFLLTGLLFWIFSLGVYTPVLQIASRLFPFLRIFRYPEKYASPAVLCFSVLAAFGFTALLSKFAPSSIFRSGSGGSPSGKERKAPGLVASGLFPFSGVLLLVSGLGIILVRNRIADWIAGRAVLPNVQSASAFIVHQACVLSVIALCCLVIALLLHFRIVKVAAVFMLILASIDIWHAASGLRWNAHRAFFDLEPTGSRIFRAATMRALPDLRIAVDRAPPGGFGAPANLNGARREAAYLRNRLWPNAGLAHGVRLAGGYSGAGLPLSTEMLDLLFKYPAELGARLNVGMFLTRRDLPNPDLASALRKGDLSRPELSGRLADEAAGMNILTALVPDPWERLHLATGWEFLEDETGSPCGPLQKVLEREKNSMGTGDPPKTDPDALVSSSGFIFGGRFHDSPGADAPAVASRDKKSSESIIESIQFGTGGFVSARAVTPVPAILVLAERFYPGWRCRMDGEELPIYRVNGLSMGVFLPSGSHDIQFTYEPLKWKRGRLISVISLICLIICVFPRQSFFAKRRSGYRRS